MEGRGAGVSDKMDPDDLKELRDRFRFCERLSVHEQWRMDNEQMGWEQFMAGEQWTPEQIKAMQT